MKHNTYSSSRRAAMRLLATLAAISLPILVATFISGSFLHVGTLRPGEVFDATAAHAAPFATGTTTGTPGVTGTGTPGTTGTPGVTGTGTGTTGTTTGTPGATGTGTGTPQPTCSPAGMVSISITESGFNPSSITVNPGTMVMWTNNGTQRHRVRDINHVIFDSDDLQPGQTFSYVFCTPGNYPYEDSRTSFTGSIVVTGTPPTGTAGTTGTPGATGTAGTTGTPGTTGTAGTTGTPGATGTPQTTPTPSGNIVNVAMMSHDVFMPANVTVSTGTTVRWTNQDDETHTSTSDTGVWNSGALSPGQTFYFTFNSPGTYIYHCLIHSEMQGTIVVTGTEITPTPGTTTTGTPQATNTPVSGTANVTIQNYSFQPASITVAPGTTVRWTNQDADQHTTTSDTSLWNSGNLAQNQTFEYTFNTPGTYGYYCSRHPGMRGTIVVSSGGATGTPQTTGTPGITGTPGTTGTPQTTSTPGTTGTATAQVTTTGTAQATGTVQATATSIPQTVNVNIQSYAYVPANVTIHQGDTIRWTNLDNDRHSVTSSGFFDSGEFTLNQTWQYTFNTPGTYTYICTVHGPFMSGTITVQGIAPTATPTRAPGQVFSDVFPTDYFYAPVNWLVSQGIVSGYNDGMFRPYNNATRAQLTKMVVLGEGWPIANPSQPTFSDVLPGTTFYGYVETAFAHNIISGYSNGTFRPSDNVTRGQLAKIVVLARGWTLANPSTARFSDVPVGSTFFRFAETAVSHSIIAGYSDNTYHPSSNATRGQISKIIYNALVLAR